MGTFCHLRVASCFSMRRSLVRLAPLMDALAELGQAAVAVTDRNGLCGVVPFVRLARERGIHPVVGCELSVAAGEAESPRPLTLLAETGEGYRNLCRLVTRAHAANPPMVVLEDLLRREAGLLLLTGGEGAAVPALVAARREGEAIALLRRYREAFAGRLYLELQPCHREPYLLWRLRELAQVLDLTPVVTHDVRYVEEREAGLWRALQNAHGLGHPTAHPRHLAGEAEVRRLWHDLPEVVVEAGRIAARCDAGPELGVPRLPRFEPAEVADGE